MTTLVAAARSKLRDIMARDESILVLGQDVATGGPFGLSKGLASAFGEERVRNTPISEAAVMGVAIGCALAGMKPLVDLMFDDFVTLASDQLFNHAAQLHYVSGGRYSVPLTVWTVAGSGTRWGAQHSQRLDGWFAQVPGIKLIEPSSPSAAASCIEEAVNDPDPVVILVDRLLLYRQGVLPGDPCSPWDPRVVRLGRDVTVITTGRLVHLAMVAADRTAVSAEVIDLQRVSPLSTEVILQSLSKTGRCVVMHDEPAGGYVTSRLVAEISTRGSSLLRGPVRVVTSRGHPVPASPVLEDGYMVSSEEICMALLDSVSKG